MCQNQDRNGLNKTNKTKENTTSRKKIQWRLIKVRKEMKNKEYIVSKKEQIKLKQE